MISIVGFGRPKFKGDTKAKVKTDSTAKNTKTCPTCGQTVK